MNWAKILFPINRSLAGPGNLKTIKFIEKFSKKFTIKSLKLTRDFLIGNTKVWTVNKALIKDDNNKIICDFKKNFTCSRVFSLN